MESGCEQILKITDRILDGGEITEEEAKALIRTTDEDTMLLLACADKIRQKFSGRSVDLCAIVNARSGRCQEDCKFCAQSARYDTGIDNYTFLPEEEVMKAAQKAKEAGADEIFAYGTSIMRDAGNGPDFAKLVEETTGVKVRILSGTEEAYYSYIGAAGTPGVLTAVVDIGGGSTEICMGFGTDVGMCHSFQLGCVRCSKQFDTTTARGLSMLKKHCFELFRTTDLMEYIRNVKRWIGVGGTVTSLAAMIQKLDVYDSEKVQDFVIRQENVTEALKKLSAMSYDERCRTKGLMPERADIIVAGIAILDSLMEYLALSEITVSDRDLSEGLLDADVLVPNEPK